jgi:hypothetical protein
MDGAEHAVGRLEGFQEREDVVVAPHGTIRPEHDEGIVFRCRSRSSVNTG